LDKLDNLKKLIIELDKNREINLQNREKSENRTINKDKTPTLVYRIRMSDWDYLSFLREKYKKDDTRYKKTVKIAATIIWLLTLFALSSSLIANNRDYRGIRSVEVLNKVSAVEVSIDTTLSDNQKEKDEEREIENKNEVPLICQRPEPWQHAVYLPDSFQVSSDETEAQDRIQRENETRLFKIYSVN
jgi:hypothetical protein